MEGGTEIGDGERRRHYQANRILEECSSGNTRNRYKIAVRRMKEEEGGDQNFGDMYFLTKG